MTTSTSLRHVIIGTAGHIDHGKTRLIGALTGADTDRLPEEKSRGISIDLGFAHWTDGEIRFDVVDVPGHERFIRNMVAGATGIDLALLVVAADDGVMPQTREHLEIMHLLDIRGGLIAITKCDLVESELVELVREEIGEITAGTFLEGAPVVAVSSATGSGLDELRRELSQLATGLPRAERGPWFRMPIDRSFSITGHGTVVTGSVISGDVRPGDVLELLPSGQSVRVRSVENHGAAAEESGSGQRTAINLAGLRAADITRGMELAAAGYLAPSRRLLAELHVPSTSAHPLKTRMSVNLHLGTQETPARLMIRGPQPAPGESTIIELRTQDPVVAEYGQRFILRNPSPALTLAGGRILDPEIPAGRRIRQPEEYAAAMQSPDPAERWAFLLLQRDTVPHEPHEAARRAGVDPRDYDELLDDLRQRKLLVSLGPPEHRVELHRDRLQSLSATILRTIGQTIEQHQPRRTLPRATLLRACEGITADELLSPLIDHLLRGGKLVEVGSNLGLAGASSRQTKQQRQLLQQILTAITGAGLSPPTVKELAETLQRPQAEIDVLLEVSAESELLVRISPLLAFNPEAIDLARSRCRELLAEQHEATLSDLRQTWGITRKHAVPLCEYFDAQGYTQRSGDKRTAGPNLSDPPATLEG